MDTHKKIQEVSTKFCDVITKIRHLNTLTDIILKEKEIEEGKEKEMGRFIMIMSHGLVEFQELLKEVNIEVIEKLQKAQEYIKD